MSQILPRIEATSRLLRAGVSVDRIGILNLFDEAAREIRMLHQVAQAVLDVDLAGPSYGHEIEHAVAKARTALDLPPRPNPYG